VVVESPNHKRGSRSGFFTALPQSDPDDLEMMPLRSGGARAGSAATSSRPSSPRTGPQTGPALTDSSEWVQRSNSTGSVNQGSSAAYGSGNAGTAAARQLRGEVQLLQQMLQSDAHSTGEGGGDAGDISPSALRLDSALGADSTSDRTDSPVGAEANKRGAANSSSASRKVIINNIFIIGGGSGNGSTSNAPANGVTVAAAAAAAAAEAVSAVSPVLDSSNTGGVLPRSSPRSSAAAAAKVSQR